MDFPKVSPGSGIWGRIGGPLRLSEKRSLRSAFAPFVTAIARI